MSARLLLGDCLDVMARLGENSVDSIVTDPPYGLSFMGKDWDHGVPGAAFWTAALRVAKPGSYLLAFGGTRTFHRLTCAIEDGGWRIQDCLSWLYGSGFPKHKSKLKPAWEPVVLAWNPTTKATPLNIDACRIGDDVVGWAGARGGSEDLSQSRGRNYRLAEGSPRPAVGRWPANVILDDVAAAQLDEQSGELHSGERKSTHVIADRIGQRSKGDEKGRSFTDAAPSTGGASRFFYTAKASRSEREFGVESARKMVGISSGAAAAAARGEDYDIGDGGINKTVAVRNTHPTVKPVDLMRWLCQLVTPPGRMVLDLFMGSGTTGIAAVTEGFDFIGIEREPDYLEIARHRITATQPPLGLSA